jgi:hypothetical protein
MGRASVVSASGIEEDMQIAIIGPAASAARSHSGSPGQATT